MMSKWLNLNRCAVAAALCVIATLSVWGAGRPAALYFCTNHGSEPFVVEGNTYTYHVDATEGNVVGCIIETPAATRTEAQQNCTAWWPNSYNNKKSFTFKSDFQLQDLTSKPGGGWSTYTSYTFPAGRQYDVKLTYTGTQMDLDVTVPGNYTLYFDNSGTGWSQPYCDVFNYGVEFTDDSYYSNYNTEQERMTLVEGDIWKITVPAKYVMAVFYEHNQQKTTKTSEFPTVNNGLYTQSGQNGTYTETVPEPVIEDVEISVMPTLYQLVRSDEGKYYTYNPQAEKQYEVTLTADDGECVQTSSWRELADAPDYDVCSFTAKVAAFASWPQAYADSQSRGEVSQFSVTRSHGDGQPDIVDFTQNADGVPVAVFDNQADWSHADAFDMAKLRATYTVQFSGTATAPDGTQKHYHTGAAAGETLVYTFPFYTLDSAEFVLDNTQTAPKANVQMQLPGSDAPILYDLTDVPENDLSLRVAFKAPSIWPVGTLRAVEKSAGSSRLNAGPEFELTFTGTADTQDAVLLKHLTPQMMSLEFTPIAMAADAPFTLYGSNSQSVAAKVDHIPGSLSLEGGNLYRTWTELDANQWVERFVLANPIIKQSAQDALLLNDAKTSKPLNADGQQYIITYRAGNSGSEPRCASRLDGKPLCEARTSDNFLLEQSAPQPWWDGLTDQHLTGLSGVTLYAQPLHFFRVGIEAQAEGHAVILPTADQLRAAGAVTHTAIFGASSPAANLGGILTGIGSPLSADAYRAVPGGIEIVEAGVRVSDASGRLVGTSLGFHALPSGLYIITYGSSATKVIL